MGTRVRLLALVVLAALPFAPAASAQEAEATKDGWWNAGVTGLPITPPSTVPADSFAVGATRGEVDKVAAIAIGVTLPFDTRLDGLTMFLTESETPGAQISADDADVFACPATSFWGEAKNGDWDDRPAADCGIDRSDGFRSDDGTWTFDLTEMGVLWTTGALDPNGIVLSVDTETGGGDVQVSFLDSDTDEVDFFVTAAAVGQPTPPPTPAPTTAPTPTFDPAPPPPPIDDVPAPTPTASPAIIVVEPARRQGGPIEPDLFGGLPVLVWIGIPALLGLGLVTSYALGPAGRPDPSAERRGPIGRVLDRRRSGTGG